MAFKLLKTCSNSLIFKNYTKTLFLPSGGQNSKSLITQHVGKAVGKLVIHSFLLEVKTNMTPMEASLTIIVKIASA